MSDYQARDAIKNWEEYNYQIQKLRFYWSCGLVSILIGFFVYIKIDMWVGMVGFITGFSEMIYWTSPTFIGLFGSRYEFATTAVTILLIDYPPTLWPFSSNLTIETELQN